MKRQLIIASIAVFLLAQQAVLADDKHRYRQHDSDKHDSDRHDSDKHKSAKYDKDKHKRYPYGVRAKLKLLGVAIAVLNAEVEKLKLQGGDLPPDLDAQLAALQLTVDNNASDISLALTDIVDILQEISVIMSTQGDHTSRLDSLESNVADVGVSLSMLSATVNDLELRILALEQTSPPPATTVVFSSAFEQNIEADAGVQQAWTDFRNSATGSFGSIEIKNSFNNSVVCNDPAAATQIANELNSHILTTGSLASFTCGTLVWNVGACISGVELNAGLSPGVCSCGQGAVVRPRIGNFNWGGVGINFGGTGTTCGAPSQTLEVILTR